MMNNIGEARRSYGLSIGKEVTQDMAAAMFDVSPSGYKKWEQGVGKLNGEILCRIADKYGCSVDYLLCRVEDPAPYPARTSRHPSLADDEQELVDSYRATHDYFKPEISDYAARQAERHPKKQDNGDTGSVVEAV